MQRFWSRWAAIVNERPGGVVAIALALCGFFAYHAATTPLDLSFTSMIDRSDPEVVGYEAAMDTFGASTLLLLLIEGEPAAVDRAVAAVVEELPSRTELKRVVEPLDPAWLMDRAPWFWPAPFFSTVVEQVRLDTVTASTRTAIEAGDGFIRQRVRPRDDAALVQIEMKSRPLDMAIGGAEFRAIARETGALLEERGIEVSHGFTGIAAVGAQDQNNVLRRIKILTPVTLVLVLFIVLWAEPNPRSVLLAGLALAGAVGVAFGLLGLIRGTLTIGATFFGMALLGLGIDFGIHLLVTLRDGRSHGLEAPLALEQGIRKTGTAIALGGVSTALAFGLVALVPEPGARDMGLVALFGLLAALVLMLTLLPASWLLFERRLHERETPPRMHLPGLRQVVTWSLQYPKTVLALAGFATVAGAVVAPQYHIETDLEEIISRDLPALRVQERLEELFGISPTVYIAPVESLEEARQVAAEFRALPEVGQVMSAADFVPPDAAKREAAMREALERAHAKGPVVERLARALEAGPVTLETLPEALALSTVGKNGALAVRVVPEDYTLDAQAITNQIERFRRIAPSTTGMPVMAKIAVTGQQDYVPLMIPAIFAVVTVVLIAAFRNVRDVALALIPVTFGTAVGLGIFVALDLQFSVLTSIVVPVILGLGVDDGIHVVERLRHHRAREAGGIHDAIEGVGRPIFLTTVTTVVSFLGLLFTGHTGLESVAIFMAIGVPLCFVASVTVLPAAAVVFGRQPSDS